MDVLVADDWFYLIEPLIAGFGGGDFEMHDCKLSSGMDCVLAVLKW